MRERRCWNNVVFHCGALVGKTRGSRAFLTFGAFFLRLHQNWVNYFVCFFKALYVYALKAIAIHLLIPKFIYDSSVYNKA